MRPNSLDIVVLNYNNWEETKQFVESVIFFNCIHRIIIVDNCSTDNSFEILKKMDSWKVHTIKTDKNGGYGYGNNYGVSFLAENDKPKYVAICNPDIIVDEKTLIACESFLKDHSDYSVVSPWMRDINDHDVNCGWFINSWKKILFGQTVLLGKTSKPMFVSKNNKEFVRCDAVAGSLLIVNVNDFLLAGGYDENIFLYSEESVLGFRMKKIGKNSALLSNYHFIHKGSTSISKQYKSSFARQRMILKSQKYMFKEYYHIGFFGRVFMHFMCFIILFETSIYDLYKKVKFNKKHCFF